MSVECRRVTGFVSVCFVRFHQLVSALDVEVGGGGGSDDTAQLEELSP